MTLRLGLRRASLLGLFAIIATAHAARTLDPEPWQLWDDQLYWTLAKSFVAFVRGESDLWLGPYTSLTLSKLPGYPLYLALIHASRIPLHLAEGLLLCGAIALFLRAWRLTRYGAVLANVLLLGFLPDLLRQTRLIRHDLSIILTLYFLAAIVALAVRRHEAAASRRPWAWLAALVAAMLFLVREESIAQLVTWFGVVCWVSWTARAAGRLRRELVHSATQAAILFVPILIVCCMNFFHYGFFTTTFRRYAPLLGLYQAFVQIDPTPKRYIPADTAARQTAYRVSACAKTLSPYLEGVETDPLATSKGHHLMNGYPNNTREFYVSTFEFALQSALFQAARGDPVVEGQIIDRCEAELSAYTSARLGWSRHGYSTSIMAPFQTTTALALADGAIDDVRALLTLRSMETAFEHADKAENWKTDATAMSDFIHQTADRPNATLREGYLQLLSVVRVVYPLGFLLFMLSLGRSIYRSLRYRSVMELNGLQLIAVAGLAAQAASMTILHHLGFPTLPWGQGYVAGGYVHLVFAILVPLNCWATSYDAESTRSAHNVTEPSLARPSVVA